MTSKTRGALPFPPDPAAPRVGPAGPRSGAGTSAGAASGTENEFSSNVSSLLISFPDRDVVPSPAGHRITRTHRGREAAEERLDCSRSWEGPPTAPCDGAGPDRPAVGGGSVPRPARTVPRPDRTVPRPDRTIPRPDRTDRRTEPPPTADRTVLRPGRSVPRPSPVQPLSALAAGPPRSPHFSSLEPLNQPRRTRSTRRPEKFRVCRFTGSGPLCLGVLRVLRGWTLQGHETQLRDESELF
jgi:hypothetical protein